MGNLTSGMYPRIRPPRPDHRNRLSYDRPNRFLQHPLHRALTRLGLPAMKPRPHVLHQQGDPGQTLNQLNNRHLRRIPPTGHRADNPGVAPRSRAIAFRGFRKQGVYQLFIVNVP